MAIFGGIWSTLRSSAEWVYNKADEQYKSHEAELQRHQERMEFWKDAELKAAANSKRPLSYRRAAILVLRSRGIEVTFSNSVKR